MDDAISEAIRLAHRSYMTQRHGAVIIRNGEVIARGTNRHESHLYHLFSLHAEMDCIADLKKKYAAEVKSRKWMRDCRMVVVRVSNAEKGQERLRMSKPCRFCKRAIEETGIPIVFYSNEIHMENNLTA
jgi:deoxycytidylate deaminase